MTYLKVSLTFAIALSGPWMIYQLWLFVAAGLYPSERKAVTRYIPLSIGLFLGGVAFVYFVVLPVAIGVLISFNESIPDPSPRATVEMTTQPTLIPQYAGDPSAPKEMQVWFNTVDGRLKFYHDGQASVISYGPDLLVVPGYSLKDHIDFALISMLMFGVCFQMPLVVMVLARVGIVTIAGLRKSRRLVYFIMSIVAAFLSPGDLLISMLMLLIPMIILFELGILLARRGEKAAASDAE
jgi:Sec-independent protein secretion pathway component TatC